MTRYPVTPPRTQLEPLEPSFEPEVVERSGVRFRALRPLEAPGDPTIETHEVYLDELQDPEMRAFLEAEYAASLEPDPLVEAREIYLDELQGLDPETRALLEAECGPGPDQSWEKLQVKVDFDGDNCFFAGLSMDVSDGGLFVTTYQPSAVGTKVMLFVSLPDGHALAAPGEVKFVMDDDIDGEQTPHGMGVTFLRLSDEDLAAIRKFCRKRPPTYYDLD